MTEFTPILSTSGGMLIGLSAVAVFIFLDVFSGYRGVSHSLNFDFVRGSWRPFFNRFGEIARSAIDGFAIAAWI